VQILSDEISESTSMGLDQANMDPREPDHGLGKTLDHIGFE